MDFSFTEEQEELAGLAAQILEGQLTEERMREVEAGPGRFDRDTWAELAKANLLGVGIPEDLGGIGYGILEQCKVLEQLGRFVAPAPYLASVVMGASVLAEFGSDEQKKAWVPAAVAGEKILTAAVVEDLNPDPATVLTRAERTETGWKLTGVKTTVPAGPLADLFLVPASTDEGVTVFLVEPGAAGVAVEVQDIVNGDREALLRLDGAEVSGDAVLGAVGQGAEIAASIERRATVGLCAHQLGVVAKALEVTAEYSKERIQFDRPIATFQAVGQRMADGFIDVEGVRATLWQAAWRFSEGLPCDTEIEVAKFWASDAGHRIAHTTVHIHGGTGIDLDNNVHRYFTAAKQGEFALGSATQQLLKIGATLAAG